MTLLRGRIGGTSVYASSLLDALRDEDDIDVVEISSSGSGALNTLRWMVSDAPARIRQVGADVLHGPAFLAPLNQPVPLVLTVHDLSLARMPSGHAMEWRMFYRLLFPRIVRKAAAVLTPTEFTRRQIIEELGLPAERVVTTPEGVDSQFFVSAGGDTASDNPQPVILFPGPPIGRKNLDAVLRVLETSPPQSPLAAARLQITGAVAVDFPRYSRRMERSGLGRRVEWLGALPFESLPSIYARADVLVYPSLLEGFGLPPLEAMAVGTPVVAARASSLPEVLGDAALLFDPVDDAALTHALASMLTDAGLRRRMIERGHIRAQMFTWKRCAGLTAAVYRDVVSGQASAARRSKTA